MSKDTSGNMLLADYLEWAWSEISAGRPETLSNLGRTARDTMDAGLRLIIDELRKQGCSKELAPDHGPGNKEEE